MLVYQRVYVTLTIISPTNSLVNIPLLGKIHACHAAETRGLLLCFPWNHQLQRCVGGGDCGGA